MGKRGLFITFEGQDGAGKSTQIDLLAQFLREKGYDVVLTREPGGCPIAEKIRDLLLDVQNADMNAVTEALLYAAARAELVRKVILPALMSGKVVLCDRYIDSSIAYQGYGRQLGYDTVIAMNKAAMDTAIPDLTLFLRIDPEEGFSRNRDNGREKDRLECENEGFRQSVYEGFLEQAKRESRVQVVEAKDSVGGIHENICRLVLETIQKKDY